MSKYKNKFKHDVISSEEFDDAFEYLFNNMDKEYLKKVLNHSDEAIARVIRYARENNYEDK